MDGLARAGCKYDLPRASRPILVVCCPKSGSRYAAKSFVKSGLDVGHENLGKDGSVSNFLAVDDYYYHGRHRDFRLSQLDFDHTFQQVREPLSNISSLASFKKLWWWHWQEKHTGISYDEGPVARSAKFYWKWNTMISDRLRPELVYRVEDMRDYWPEICERLKIESEFPEICIVGSTPPAHLESIQWEDIKSEDPVLYDRVRWLAGRLGYE